MSQEQRKSTSDRLTIDVPKAGSGNGDKKARRLLSGLSPESAQSKLRGASADAVREKLLAFVSSLYMVVPADVPSGVIDVKSMSGEKLQQRLHTGAMRREKNEVKQASWHGKRVAHNKNRRQARISGKSEVILVDQLVDAIENDNPLGFLEVLARDSSLKMYNKNIGPGSPLKSGAGEQQLEISPDFDDTLKSFLFANFTRDALDASSNKLPAD